MQPCSPFAKLVQIQAEPTLGGADSAESADPLFLFFSCFAQASRLILHLVSPRTFVRVARGEEPTRQSNEDSRTLGPDWKTKPTNPTNK
jgi:hypothetical protein